MQAEFTASELAKIEAATQRIGREFFARMDVPHPRPWQRQWWDEQMLDWAMGDEAVKVQMFRFVDVLPSLHSSRAVVEHLHEYFADVEERLPAMARLGLPLATPGSLAGHALARATRLGARNQARQFIAGTNVEEVLAAAKHQRNLKCAHILDILGEAVTNETEADHYYHQYSTLLREVPPVLNAWPEIPLIDRDHRGPLPRANVSIKLSALDSQADEIDPAGTLARVGRRLRPLLRLAREQHAYLHVDMESYHLKDLTLFVFKEILSEPEFRDFADVGIVIQCYLREAERDLRELAEWAAQRSTPVCVRLVKGAYWDHETITARARGWPIPVFQQKWESDANFERCSRFLLQHTDLLRPAIASHNVRSLAHALATAEFLRLPQAAVEVQMLYGMADPEKAAIVDMNYRLRVYMPYGELIPGMAYLVRRLLENTSNDSFLRASFTERIAPEKLLMNPLDHKSSGKLSDRANPALAAVSGEAAAAPPYWKTFQNEPLADFALAANRKNMQNALAEVQASFGAIYPLIIETERIETEEQIVSRDPSDKETIVGVCASATVEHVDRAVEVARNALPGWIELGAAGRADYLRRAAQVMRQRRFELAAWEVYECGKTWREADADVCEAIDFLEFYSAGAIAMESPHGHDVPGEENRFVYQPRGVVGVIAPWNFPLAILTGMTSAALATGNVVIMKPAEQSSVIAGLLMDIFADLDIPPGTLQYLPGRGEVVGARLVDHPEVDLIAFTGSREVGLAINRRAAEVSEHSTRGVKRVIAEMGGKNAILVDEDADLDEAVLGVLRSAFGYQGQKCSACSRAIVLEPAYDAFLERLIEAARSLKVGLAEDPATSVGPVIDNDSHVRIQSYIALGRAEGRVALAVDAGNLAETGYFIGPHIFADVSADARIAQEEIFGPVLAVIRAHDFSEAIRMVNGTQYALTAGVYSRSPANLERAAKEIMVGNLYLNRGCTGALVSRQPFGGFKMSGIGSQAGGPDYLLQFVVPRTITENTLRRGFAPPSGE